MTRRMFKLLTVLLPLLLLSACGGIRQSDKPGGAERTFTSDAYGFAIAYPSDFALQPDFSQSYLQNGSWKTYAGPGSRGQPVAALVLEGSNEVTDAELRIGVSRNAEAVSECTQPPQAFRKGSLELGTVRLAGERFAAWKAADAAMSHYLQVHSYRAVHDGACYAIDLLVYGTNPKVYDPPRRPPFTQQQAFARLEAALKGFRFIRK